VDVAKVAGTDQTARDLGASVLLSSGTGTGQLDFTSGVVKSNLVQILATALTETAGLLAGGFKKFFNVAAPTGTLNSLPDAVAGATNGLAIVGSAMTLAAAQRVKLDAAQPDYAPAIAGAELSLTPAERESTAVVVESHLLDEGDSQMLINAIVGAIGNTNLDEAAVVAAIRADLERSGGNLNTLIGRLTSARAGYLDNLSAGAVALAAAQAAQGTILTNLSGVIVTKLDTMLEADSAVYRYTAAALAQAPVGTGGGGSAPDISVEFTNTAVRT
jgi:hypothetical protein